MMMMMVMIMMMMEQLLGGDHEEHRRAHRGMSSSCGNSSRSSKYSLVVASSGANAIMTLSGSLHEQQRSSELQYGDSFSRSSQVPRHVGRNVGTQGSLHEHSRIFGSHYMYT